MAAVRQFQILIFDDVNAIGFNICCSVPNFIKMRRFFTEILQFNDFPNGVRPPSWILKFAVFVSWPSSACHSASSSKISLKSDNQLMSYGQKSDF